MSEHDVSVRTRFERFPATVKGAFVVHGEDGDPHLVGLSEARVVSLGAQAGMPLPMKPAVVNCPPREDMFVPFEFPLTDLEPGWFELECDVTVDGAPRTVRGGKRFLIHWPRSTTRRGTIEVGEELGSGPDAVTVQQIDCATDRSTLRYRSEAPAPLRLVADGQRLPELSATFDDGAGSVECYPLLRAHGTLRIEIARGPSIEFDLP